MKTWQAPAKLNLFLHVVGRYDNGYHELQTVYQFIDWSDELKFELTGDGQIKRVNEISGIPGPQCLTVKAARALRNRKPGVEGVNIQLEKHVPVGAGLGGGSSDAATTLIALTELWGLDCSSEELAEIGSEIGADVPVFVSGRNAWAEGKGEILSDISLPGKLYLVVVPPVEVSTRNVFQGSCFSSFRDRISPKDFEQRAVWNDLEETTCRHYPEVGAVLQWLRGYGPARMTGSGGAVFLEIETENQADEILKQLPEDCHGRVCVGRGGC